MKNKFFKTILASILSIFLSIGLANISIADDHKPKKEIIKDLKKEIHDLGGEPIKRKHLLYSDKKWIVDLKEKLEKLKKEKKKQDRIEAAKLEIQKEIEALGGKPITKTKDIDEDEEIIALRKQLNELKAEKDKKKAKDKKTKENKKARDEAIQSIKKEIIFLGETPISEFEINNEDKYLAALNKQLDELKMIKEQEEKEIQQSIPSWFIKIPKGSEQIIYVRGTAVVDTLQGSIDSATNAALRELGKKLETRLNSKVSETVRQAGMGEDIVTKSEMNRVSSLVVKEVTISGYEVTETKMLQLDNGNYRSFVLLEYPVAQVYKAFINRIERQSKLQNKLPKIKDTDAFKELEELVDLFTSA